MAISSSQSTRPLALSKQGENQLTIDWSDGHRSVYSWKHLRDNCPCAGCKGEFGQPPDPFRILTASELAPKPPLAPVEISPVGNYAYKIVWNDGHDTGLLSELAPKPPLAPVEIAPVGNYAYKIVWNDGHDTGLFTLEYLRQLCECPLCKTT